MKPSNFKIPAERLAGSHVIKDHIVHIVKPKHVYPNIKINAENDAFIFPQWEHPDLFGNDQPVHVEYCSGNGAWIVARALANPHINWVAVELKLGRTRKIWSKIKNLNLTNLIVVNGEGEFVTEKYFPKNSVSAVYINFPDPWPKRHHARYRIIKPSFLQSLSTLLKSKGQIIVVTDDASFSEWTIKTFKIFPHFHCPIDHPYYYTEWPHYGDSFFDTLWREKGRTIRYHHFIKNEAVINNVIHLDATLKSTLDWEKEIAEAAVICEKNTRILWKLDFGLFNQLQYPLTSQQQFQTFRLAIDHFKEAIWSRFKECSEGVILYEGSLDSIENATDENIRNWAEERFDEFEENKVQKGDRFLHALYSRDISLDYLKQLAALLPYEANCFISKKIVSALPKVEKAIFFNEECYRPLQFLMDESASSEARVGVCLPPITSYNPGLYLQLNEIVDELDKNGVPYRFIAEEALINSIEGLDQLFVVASGLSAQGKRKLQGFIAAGGEVLYR